MIVLFVNDYNLHILFDIQLFKYNYIQYSEEILQYVFRTENIQVNCCVSFFPFIFLFRIQDSLFRCITQFQIHFYFVNDMFREI